MMHMARAEGIFVGKASFAAELLGKMPWTWEI